MAATNDQDPVNILLGEIQEIVGGSTSILQDGKKRAALLQTSKRLTAVLEKPDEIISEVALSPYRSMCLRVGIDLNIFSHLANSPNPLTADELAERSGTEKDLIVRFLRVLSEVHIVAETDKQTYTATPATIALSKRSPPAGVRFFFDQGFPILHKMPEYFKLNSYRLPTSYTDGPLQFAHGTSLDAYHYWEQTPGIIENFHVFMDGLLGTPGRSHWTDSYDVQKFIFDEYKEEVSDVVFVDVGGGNGHEAEELKAKHPDAKGRFIVQDLPEVVREYSGPDKTVEFIPHNFLTAQPIKYAKAYFLQNILHNWPDQDCVTILEHVAAAMHKDYSRLLIANIILPERNCPSRQAKLDIAMLVLHNGSQRTEEQWALLLEKAGLEPVNFWHTSADGDGVVEAKVRTK